MKTITHSEASELKRLERVISKGMKSFVEVGNALKRIKEEGLYRASHKSFAAYVEDKWGMTKKSAYRLITAGETVETVSHGTLDAPPLANERQARELAKAPADQQAEIWGEVVDEHEKPTAANVKDAVDRRKPKAEPVDDVPAADPSDESWGKPDNTQAGEYEVVDPPEVNRIGETFDRLVSELEAYECRVLGEKLIEYADSQ